MTGNEFRSKVEDFVENVKELKFPSSSGFGGLRHFFSESSVSHPAKANLYLLRYLIEKYTKPGDVVCDNMAGTGSTGIVASYLGRHSILVELEEKFVKWINENVEVLEKKGGKKGEIKVLKGDARKLSELLGVNANTILTSPPYSEGIGHSQGKRAGYDLVGKDSFVGYYGDGGKDNIGNLKHGEISTVITSPPYSDSISKQGGETGKGVIELGVGKSTITARRYSDSPNNIGNLPHGEVNTIITSPPYSETLSVKAGGGSLKNAEGKGIVSDLRPQAQGAPKPYSSDLDEAQIGNLRHGNIENIGTIITSPPYAETYVGGGDAEKRRERLVKAGHDPKDFLGGKARNAVLKHYDEVNVVITSPPYADSKRQPSKIDVEREVLSMETDTRSDTQNRHTLGRIRAIESMLTGYGKNEENIGNLPLGEIDAVITSPPYADIAKSKEGGISPHMQGLISKLSGIPVKEFAHDVEKLKEAVKIAQSKIPFKYSDGSDNIGNLPHGNVDAVITSPPYSNSAIQDYGTSNKALLEFERHVRESFRKFGYFEYEGKRYTEKEWREVNKGELKPRGMPKLWAEIVKQRSETRYDDGYQDNIANLPHGEITTIITSPPYANRLSDGFTRRNSINKTIERNRGRVGISNANMTYSENPENIGNLPLGNVNTIITSPPYESSVSDGKEGPLVGADEQKYGRWKKGTAKKHSYTQEGEPCKVDSVITSPPYEGSLEGTTRHTRGGIASRDPALAQTGSYATVMSFGVPVGYSPSVDNIGNLKSDEKEYEELEKDNGVTAVITSPPYAEANRGGGIAIKGYEGYYGRDKNLHLRHDRPLSDNPNNISNIPFTQKLNEKPSYLSEMLRVYGECYKVLKPGGKAIIVVKPFVRNKKVVDLPFHSFLLLQQAGFRLVDVLKFRLPTQSFWRVLQYSRCDYSKRATECKLFGECKPKLEKKKQSECTSYVNSVERICHEYVVVCQK